MDENQAGRMWEGSERKKLKYYKEKPHINQIQHKYNVFITQARD